MDFPLWDVDASGRWLAIVHRPAATSPAPAQIRIQIHDLTAGGMVRNIALPYVPVRITAAMLDTVFSRYPPAIPRAALQSALFLPGFVPPVVGLVVSDSGAVWIQKFESLSRTVWQRVERDGRQTDIVRLPVAHLAVDARGRDLLAISRDPDIGIAPALLYSPIR
jgi:hypothetical protein